MIDDYTEPKRILPIKKIKGVALFFFVLYLCVLVVDFTHWLDLRAFYDDIEATRLDQSIPEGWTFLGRQGRTFDVRTSPQSGALCHLVAQPMLGPARTFVTIMQPFTYMTPAPERLLHLELDYERAGGYPCGRRGRGELILQLKLGVVQ